MRYSRLPLLAALSLMLTNSTRTSAQRHEIPPLNSCIKEFYDPGMYDYLTFQNTCTQSLTVVLVAKDNSGDGGTLELRPGGKDSVGLSKGKKPQPGSFALYVCQSGYVPLDDSGKVVSKPDSNFRCSQKAK